MKTREIYTIGMRLIGICFAVLAFTGICLVVCSLLSTVFRSKGPFIDIRFGTMQLLFGFLQPLAYIVASFVLIRKTDWCLRKLQSLTGETLIEPTEGSSESDV